MKNYYRLSSLSLCFVFCIFSFCAFCSFDDDFRNHYYDESLSPRHCGRNIEDFLKWAMEKNELTAPIYVLKITASKHSWTMGLLPALKSRFGKEQGPYFRDNWVFHIVAFYQGKVYDFSFDKTPRILDLKNYLYEMFVPTVPFEINGPSFRVMGMGPLYDSRAALMELDYFEFSVFKLNQDASLSLLFKDLNYLKVLSL